MKKLYQGKGKVHPSPDADSAFKFLPVAIATLSAALMPEDQEVLAYLIAWSLEGPEQQSKRRPMTQGRIHGPTFDCSCFECYTSFWSRWDASPNRHLIHEALDLFEDHMATADRASSGRGNNNNNNNSKGHRRAGREDNRKQLMSWLEQNRKPEIRPGRFCVGKERDDDTGTQGAAAEVLESGNRAKGRVSAVDFEEKARQPSDKPSPHSQATGRGLMRRVFPDIMSSVAERLWTVWSPPGVGFY